MIVIISLFIVGRTIADIYKRLCINHLIPTIYIQKRNHKIDSIIKNWLLVVLGSAIDGNDMKIQLISEAP